MQKNKKNERELCDERILGSGEFVSDVLEHVEKEENAILRNKKKDRNNRFVAKKIE